MAETLSDSQNPEKPKKTDESSERIDLGNQEEFKNLEELQYSKTVDKAGKQFLEAIKDEDELEKVREYVLRYLESEDDAGNNSLIKNIKGYDDQELELQEVIDQAAKNIKEALDNKDRIIAIMGAVKIFSTAN